MVGFLWSYPMPGMKPTLISRICRLSSDLVPYLLRHPSHLLPQPQHLLNLLGLPEPAVCSYHILLPLTERPLCLNSSTSFSVLTLPHTFWLLTSIIVVVRPPYLFTCLCPSCHVYIRWCVGAGDVWVRVCFVAVCVYLFHSAICCSNQSYLSFEIYLDWCIFVPFPAYSFSLKSTAPSFIHSTNIYWIPSKGQTLF